MACTSWGKECSIFLGQTNILKNEQYENLQSEEGRDLGQARGLVVYMHCGRLGETLMK